MARTSTLANPNAGMNETRLTSNTGFHSKSALPQSPDVGSLQRHWRHSLGLSVNAKCCGPLMGIYSESFKM